MADNPPNEEKELAREQKLAPCELQFLYDLENPLWEYVRARFKRIGLRSISLVLSGLLGACGPSYKTESVIQQRVDREIERHHSKMNEQSARLEVQIAGATEARAEAACAADAANGLVERVENKLAEIDRQAYELERKLVSKFEALENQIQLCEVEVARIETLLKEKGLTDPQEPRPRWLRHCLSSCGEEHSDLGPEFVICVHQCHRPSNQE